MQRVALGWQHRTDPLQRRELLAKVRWQVVVQRTGAAIVIRRAEHHSADRVQENRPQAHQTWNVAEDANAERQPQLQQLPHTKPAEPGHAEVPDVK